MIILIIKSKEVVCLKEIYLAGGCFWGLEEYILNIKGVIKTEVGYANGNTKNPSYEDVCHKNTGHAETVKVIFNEEIINLSFLLDMYYDVIDPTSINRQGGDVGSQYRTGIYYIDIEDKTDILKSIEKLYKKINKPIAIEVKELFNYYPAEEYHQHYLKKNPGGYCHINIDKFENAKRTNSEEPKSF